ncbi:MAG: hypothetical protein KA198_03545 [Chitinophagaceae bacterium]|nr:hypothetical protein [Chitinophagaceae bacterium]
MKLNKNTLRDFSLWNYLEKWFKKDEKPSFDNSLSKNIRLYKNNSKLYTNLFISSAYDQNYQIQLVDNYGKVLYTKTTDCNSEAKVIALPTNSFAAGKYAVIVSNQTEEVVMQFEK